MGRARVHSRSDDAALWEWKLTIADRHLGYAEDVAAAATEAGLRVEIDRHSGKLGAKIRDAQMQKVPFMLIVGDRDMEEEQVSVRHRTAGDLGSQTMEEFLAQAVEDIDARAVREWPMREGRTAAV